MSIQDQNIQEINQFGYKVLKQLGKGAFGIVYLGLKNEQQFAIKVIEKSLILGNQKLMELFESEKQLLTKIKSKYIVQMVEFQESRNRYYLVMEYCNGGNLREYMINQKYITEKEAKGYLIQLLNGFQDLHSYKVIHRDIKFENIMRHYPKGVNGEPVNGKRDSDNVVLKIVDLGLAKDMKEELITNTLAGSKLTMAPEIIRQRPYGFEVDIYSLGVILYQMVQGKFPYYETNDKKLLQMIKEQNLKFSEDKPVSEAFQDLIRQMLKYNRKERIRWSDILYHQVFQPQLMATKSQQLTDIQFKQINQSLAGFEQMNDMYEISFHFPLYKFQKKLIPQFQNINVNNYLAVSTQNERDYVVVQQVLQDYYTKKDFEQTQAQINDNYKTIQQISQKNIMQIKGFSQRKDKFYIVSEYLENGNLSDQIRQNKEFSQDDIIQLLYNILSGLRWLHENKMIHRNINLKSIYVGLPQFTNYKLGGFKYCYSYVNKSKQIMSNYNGMSFYTAPEILENKIYTDQSDIYSLGIVLYEIVYGNVPYKGQNKQELLKNINSNNRQERRLKKQYDKQLLDIIDSMIEPSKNKRITFEELWNSELFTKYISGIEDNVQEMLMFYQSQNNKFSLSQYIDQNIFESLIEQSIKFSQVPIQLPQAPSLISMFSSQKFNSKNKQKIFAVNQAFIPQDQLLYCINLGQYSQMVNKHDQSILEFKQQQQKSQIKQQENEDVYFQKFIERIKGLIQKGKQTQDFELCIYYTKIQEDMSQKKQEYDKTQDPYKKKQLLQQLHINYEKVFKQS